MSLPLVFFLHLFSELKNQNTLNIYQQEDHISCYTQCSVIDTEKNMQSYKGTHNKLSEKKNSWLDPFSIKTKIKLSSYINPLSCRLGASKLFCKGPDREYFRLAGHTVSVTTTQSRYYIKKSSHRQHGTNEPVLKTQLWTLKNKLHILFTC